VKGLKSRMDRAIPRPSSSIVGIPEPACHAGGRGFEFRRSRIRSSSLRLTQSADLVCGDRAGEAFEFEFAGGRCLDGLLDGCEDVLADQDLPRSRLSAEP
jgi:hypothetical protein